MDDRFFHAFLPPTVTVCGRELETFSLWHHLVLSAVESPIALGGASVSVVDLLVAVRICATKYGEKTICPGIRDAMWKRRMIKKPALFRRQTEIFYQWMSLQSSPPVLYRNNPGGVTGGVESGSRCLALACSMMHRGKLSQTEAWNMNLGKAMWMDAQFARLEGVDLRFLDDDDLDDSPIDLSGLTETEAREYFCSILTPTQAEAVFNNWWAQKKGGLK